MRNQASITAVQLQSLQQILQNLGDSKAKRELKFMYTALTPNKVYAKYTSYEVMDDNSILSKEEVKCVDKNGKVSDCLNNFDNLNQKVQFLSELIEISFDANGNIIIL